MVYCTTRSLIVHRESAESRKHSARTATLTKTFGKPFQKGKSGNPGGRAKVDQELQGLKNLTKEQLKEVYNLVLTYRREDLEKLISLPDTPVLVEYACHIILKGMETGDPTRLEALLERLIGKVPTENKDTKDIRVVLEQAEQLKKLPTIELKRLAQEAIEQLPEDDSHA